MKKLVLALTALLATSTAFADPSIVVIEFTCPTTTGAGPHTLSNYGSRVAGYGTETIDGNPAFNSPYFNFTIGTANIPPLLTSYSSSGTGYNSITGVVSCSYTSSGAFDPITVVYEMTNSNGGQIAAQTTNTITINQFVGLKK